MTGKQARNQLGTIGGVKRRGDERGPNFLPTHFSMGDEKILRELRPPLVTGLLGRLQVAKKSDLNCPKP